MTKVMEEVHLTSIKPKNNVLLLAQEISFAKVLACNDKRLRDRGVKRLRKWFLARSEGCTDFTKDDHMRIWKGLFYCMWMSDKPLIQLSMVVRQSIVSYLVSGEVSSVLVFGYASASITIMTRFLFIRQCFKRYQEELAEEISNLIHSFASFKSSLLFVETFFASLSVEWFGIDQLRLDKFMMLVRRFIRQSLELVARVGWKEDQVQQLANVYHQILNTAPMGLSMHIIEVFCEELAKVGKGELSSDTIFQFIAVFARIMATLKDGRLISQITRFIFLHLIRQTELGIEHQMKFSAWREYGFPGGDLDAAEKVDVESSSGEEDMEDNSGEEMEEERKVGIDARAGKVDVLLPPLDFDPNDLLGVLRELRNKKDTTTKARKTLIQLINKFEHLAAGKYPLGLHKVQLPDKIDKKKEVDKAAKRWYVEEQNLIHSESDNEDNNMDLKSLKKNTQRKKAMRQKKSFWEVSESNENVDHNQSGCNLSWMVSESSSNNALRPNNLKKRKLDENKLGTSNQTKRTKMSSFTVNDIKENSNFSLQPTMLLTKSNKKKLKTMVISQNTPTEDNPLTPKTDSDNKSTKNKNKPNKSKIVQVNTKSPVAKSEKLQSAVNNPLKKNHKLSGCIENPTESPKESDKQNITKENVSELQLNTSTIDNNNGWGGEWDEPLKDGEYEIFIPNKKYVEKRKSMGLPHPVSSFIKKSAEKLTPVNKLKKENKIGSTPHSQKKVEFNLSANSSQDYKEYSRNIKKNKLEVPFDATKKPVQGLLKNSTPSPINPFYKKKLKFLTSPGDA